MSFAGGIDSLAIDAGQSVRVLNAECLDDSFGVAGKVQLVGFKVGGRFQIVLAVRCRRERIEEIGVPFGPV
jgi:hypothetical protein